MCCQQNKRFKFITSIVGLENLIREGAQNKHNINDSDGDEIVLEKQQEIVTEKSSLLESESFVGTPCIPSSNHSFAWTPHPVENMNDKVMTMILKGEGWESWIGANGDSFAGDDDDT